MQKSVSPVVGIILVIVVVVIAVVFGFKKMNSSGLTKDQEEKFLTPLKLPEKGAQAPNLTPPAPAGQPGLPAGGPGTMPVPPSPPGPGN